MKKRHLLFVALAFVSALVLAGGQKFDSASQVLDAFASELLSAYGGDEVIDNYSGSGEKFTMGDVNHDKAIDVTDAVLIIDEILDKDPADFDASLADVNHDTFIDVTDVVLVIDKILGKLELSRNAEAAYKDLTAYTAFQMDLTIPAGYVLEGVMLTEMAKDSHTLAYTMLPGGRCRIVVWSMDNEALPGAWNEVIRLQLRGQGEAQLNADHAVFVTVNGERHELLLNGTTGIAQWSTVNGQSSMVYDLQGRRVSSAVVNSSLTAPHSSLKKDLYIIDGKKFMKK